MTHAGRDGSLCRVGLAALLLAVLSRNALALASTGNDGFFSPSEDVTLALPGDGVRALATPGRIAIAGEFVVGQGSGDAELPLASGATLSVSAGLTASFGSQPSTPSVFPLVSSPGSWAAYPSATARGFFAGSDAPSAGVTYTFVDWPLLLPGLGATALNRENGLIPEPALPVFAVIGLAALALARRARRVSRACAAGRRSR